jgi:hypothetical protein
VRLGEPDLAAHGRDADAVAVAADARDDPLEEPSVPLLVERPEHQWVQQCHRAGPHRDDVPDDPAHAGRSALVRLDRAGMRVGLHLEDGGDPVPDVDRARILTRTDEDGRALGGKRSQMDLRRLVRTVLRPHRRVHRELRAVRVAAESVPDQLELVVAEPELPVELLVHGAVPAEGTSDRRDGSAKSAPDDSRRCSNAS